MIVRIIKILLLVTAILLPSLIFYDKVQDRLNFLQAWCKVKKIRADKHEYEIKMLETTVYGKPRD